MPCAHSAQFLALPLSQDYALLADTHSVASFYSVESLMSAIETLGDTLLALVVTPQRRDLSDVNSDTTAVRRLVRVVVDLSRAKGDVVTEAIGISEKALRLAFEAARLAYEYRPRDEKDRRKLADARAQALSVYVRREEKRRREERSKEEQAEIDAAIKSGDEQKI